MDVLETILSRRSVREFTSEPVSDNDVETCLRAAMSAPSAGNERPWHFVVIRDREILDEISRVHPYAQMMRATPVAIAICGDIRLEKYEGFWVQDCAAATQNILLSAQALGLGAVWVGVHPARDRVAEIRKVLGLPEAVIPLSLIPLGHPAISLADPRPDRYEPGRIRRDRW